MMSTDCPGWTTSSSRTRSNRTRVGWDWFSLQFEDGSELMLYRIRRKDGTVEPYSSGTYVDPSGRTKALHLQDFQLEPGNTWTSPETGAKYPIEWKIRVPSLSLSIALSTRLPQQELASNAAGLNSYWEGAIEVEGTAGKRSAAQATSK